MLLTQAPGDTASAFSSAVAFPLCKGVIGVAHFSTLTPNSTSAAPFGSYVVDDGTDVQTWNRDHISASLDNVVLNGYLPVARLTARAGRRVGAGKRGRLRRASDARRRSAGWARSGDDQRNRRTSRTSLRRRRCQRHRRRGQRARARPRPRLVRRLAGVLRGGGLIGAGRAALSHHPEVDVFHAIASRRETRRYSDEPIPDDVRRRILDAGRLSGSSQNTQKWSSSS